MTKHATLLERFSRHDDGGIVFKQPHDEDMPDAYREEVKFSREMWVELGEPETVTLTVEPGDMLNV